VSDGDVWRRQRRLATPAFRSAAVAAYADAMSSSAQELLSSEWSAGAEGVTRDVYEDFNALTLRIVARALFGADVRGAAAAEINAAIRDAFAFFAARTAGPPLPEWLPTPDNARFAAAVKRLDAAVYALIAARRAKMDAAAAAAAAQSSSPSDAGAAAPGADLLDRLLSARDEEASGGGGGGGGMGDVALRDELMTLLVAGQETSAIVLTWTCALLAQHPAIAARAAAEADAALGATSERLPSARDAAKLPFITAVVYETMRLLPPAYLVGRCAARDVSLGPWRIPMGTTLLVSPYLLHRSPRHWRDAATFDPTRWLSDDGVTLLPDALRGMGPNGAYVPFGAGPRNCIGTGFAMMEAVLVTASLLRRVTLALPAGGAPPATAALITLRPAAARLRITPRVTAAAERAPREAPEALAR
jgi:cytochrome P450